MSAKKVIVIGAGFSGLSAACCLAQKGFDVTILEKKNETGGRGRKADVDGFMFDMGPSWYWMPEVFEKFFNRFGKTAADYYSLKRLSPSYRVFFKEDQNDIPAEKEKLFALFESLEKGSSKKLEQFLDEAAYKYDKGVNEFVYKPSLSLLEFADVNLLLSLFRLNMFSSFSKYIRKYFTNPKLLQLLEFPVLFLGAKPENTPALYSMMNYADMVLGTWYPDGGMYKIAEAMTRLAQELGVKILTGENVEKINVEKGKVKSVVSNGMAHFADIVISGADYNFTEQKLLKKKYRTYSADYWENRVMSPSALIFYLGVNKKVDNLLHHNLFFDADFSVHATEIYDNPQWPSHPLFYLCCPSKTDAAVAPEGMENLFILIPVAVGLEDNEDVRERYFELVMNRIELRAGQALREYIVYKKAYAHSDFISDFNSFKGNAYGLANTLMQTAVLKPRIKSRKVKNLFFTGQLTVPGPGVPPSIISGQVVAGLVEKELGSV
ncbi:MAG: zeta-carotene-forming phytoene desaturase [Bacteroidia bacterium]|nr:zeta-carotene-forming phytoene desaturase [Bacteroidia bacterium]